MSAGIVISVFLSELKLCQGFRKLDVQITCLQGLLIWLEEQPGFGTPGRRSCLWLQVADVYKKFRFTLRFLLGNLYDFKMGSDAVDFEALPLADRYMLHRLWKLLTDVQAFYDNFQFFRAYQVSL